MENNKIEGLCNEEKRTVEPSNGGLSRGFEDKVKFPLWVFPETLDTVDKLYESDNSRSKSEFIEKAIEFYAGYLSANKNISYLSPMITRTVDAVVYNSEQRLSRNLFKVAVELGKVANVLAAKTNVNDETMKKLQEMVTDEVRHINGIISFEEAYKYQKE